jgi:hypothetical protein
MYLDIDDESLQIISNPMDLNQMEKKVKSERYANMLAFLADMQLIRENTYTFNTGRYLYTATTIHSLATTPLFIWISYISILLLIVI